MGGYGIFGTILNPQKIIMLIKVFPITSKILLESIACYNPTCK